MFLATFTTTQMMDALFWTLKGPEKDVPCSPLLHGAASRLLALEPGTINLLVSGLPCNIRRE